MANLGPILLDESIEVHPACAKVEVLILESLSSVPLDTYSKRCSTQTPTGRMQVVIVIDV